VVISKFIGQAKEIEFDAVAKNGEILQIIVCEQVENAGVHSGDATLVLPPQDLDKETVEKIYTAGRKISKALNVTGPLNIQFIAKKTMKSKLSSVTCVPHDLSLSFQRLPELT
jgi:carbamoyl-phosphate synthase / aspartate carbamoyltransferase